MHAHFFSCTRRSSNGSVGDGIHLMNVYVRRDQIFPIYFFAQSFTRCVNSFHSSGMLFDMSPSRSMAVAISTARISSTIHDFRPSSNRFTVHCLYVHTKFRQRLERDFVTRHRPHSANSGSAESLTKAPRGARDALRGTPAAPRPLRRRNFERMTVQ